MNQKYPIRTVALKLLEKVYLESDCHFNATINAYELASEQLDKTTIQKAGKYLSDKELIKSNSAANDEWKVTLTYDGIDWLEECYNINPCD